MSLERFIASWIDPEYPPRPVSEGDLSAVEARFRFTFPQDYRAAVLRFGLASPTIALLDAIVERELDIADLSQLLGPQEMIDRTEAWRDMGLPGTMVAFASDCCGNLFCFDAEATGAEAPVFLFDHDFGTTRAVAPSFTLWIEAYCAVAPQ